MMGRSQAMKCCSAKANVKPGITENVWDYLSVHITPRANQKDLLFLSANLI